MSDHQRTVERVIMRNAAQFEHPVFGVYFHEATREVFIFFEMGPDLTSPVSAVRYILEGDLDVVGTLKLRPWRANDALPTAAEHTETLLRLGAPAAEDDEEEP